MLTTLNVRGRYLVNSCPHQKPYANRICSPSGCQYNLLIDFGKSIQGAIYIELASRRPAPVVTCGVYVTQLRVSPNAKRHQPVTFTASFLNTTGQTRRYDWRAVVLEHGRDWGQSNPVGIAVPPCQSRFAVTYVPVTNSGGCLTLQALAAWRRQAGTRIAFANTTGLVLSVNFRVC